ncbi:MAG TPA: hypothetical protein EYQ27_12395 [Gemmatimonadetes bacterium]|jgi:hypothetical protein|nr:hypothetical protein [Gemmatimonadota bacterium]
MSTLVNPLDERSRDQQSAAPRLDGLEGKTIALLDISKPRGREFLDRLEQLLKERYAVASVVRETKPTYTKPAPATLLQRLAYVDGVIEALAD